MRRYLLVFVVLFCSRYSYIYFGISVLKFYSILLKTYFREQIYTYINYDFITIIKPAKHLHTITILYLHIYEDDYYKQNKMSFVVLKYCLFAVLIYIYIPNIYYIIEYVLLYY